MCQIDEDYRDWNCLQIVQDYGSVHHCNPVNFMPGMTDNVACQAAVTPIQQWPLPLWRMGKS